MELYGGNYNSLANNCLPPIELCLMQRPVTVVCFAMLLVHASATSSAAGFTRPLVMSGQSAPGSSPGTVYISFGVPLLNNSRQIAFTATLSGADVTPLNRNGIWSGRDALTLLTRGGEIAPELGRSFYVFDLLQLNNQGHVAYRASGYSLFTPDEAILTNRSGSLEVVASTGAPVPGVDAGIVIERFGDNNTLVFNSSGDIAFTADTTPANSNGIKVSGIWKDRGGVQSLVARSWDVAADSYWPDRYERPYVATINERGEVAFSAPVSNRSGLRMFAERDGVVKQLPADYSQATPVRLSVDEFGYSTYTSDYGRPKEVELKTDRDNFRPLASSEHDFPDYRFSMYSSMGDHAEKIISFNQYSAAGKLGFVATLAHVSTRAANADEVLYSLGASRQRLYTEFGGEMSLVATSGDHAPGTPEGVVFYLFNAGFNRDGRAALTATLRGDGVHDGNNLGLWVQSDAGELELIARVGDAFEVHAGDVRYISSLAFAGGSKYASGQSGGFNDAGDVLFRATFTDGSSGIFLHGAVPEPSGVAILATGAFALSCVQGRRGAKRWSSVGDQSSTCSRAVRCSSK